MDPNYHMFVLMLFVWIKLNMFSYTIGNQNAIVRLSKYRKFCMNAIYLAKGEYVFLHHSELECYLSD